MFDEVGSVTGNRRTAHEYVRDSIRVAILRGTIGGGTRLVQSDIARELGVSTTPVREALRDLASEGLIDLDAHRGAMVKRYDYAELMEIHDLTKLLEPEAIRLAAAHPDRAASVERASQLADRMEAETDVGRWVDLNRQFHAALISCIERRRLLAILKGLRDTVAPYVGLALQHDDYRLKAANKHHRQLVTAVRKGDGERGAKLSSAHVDLTTKALEAARDALEGR